MWTSPLLTYLVLGRSDMPLSSFAAYSLAPKSSDMSARRLLTGSRPHYIFTSDK